MSYVSKEERAKKVKILYEYFVKAGDCYNKIVFYPRSPHIIRREYYRYSNPSEMAYEHEIPIEQAAEEVARGIDTYENAVATFNNEVNCMNEENLTKLIEILKELDKTDNGKVFDQRHWHHDVCGTPACIAGWAYSMSILDWDDNLTLEKLLAFDMRPDEHNPQPDYEDMAAVWLGISYEQACLLFQPRPDHNNEVPLKDAIKTLERLRDTGKVIW